MHQAMVKALPYFEGISLIFAPNRRCKAGKAFLLCSDVLYR